MSVTTIVLAAACLTAGQAFGRPARVDESRVIVDAALHLTAIGVSTIAPPVFVEDVAGEKCVVVDPVTSEAYAAEACADWDGSIYLSPNAASDAQAYAWFVSRRAGRERRSALSWCRERCVPIVATVLHELGHVDRMRVRGGWSSRERAREEGVAEAVAQDQLCPFVWMVAASRICEVGVGYPVEVAAIRTESARAVSGPWMGYQARRWRLSLLTGTVK